MVFLEENIQKGHRLLETEPLLVRIRKKHIREDQGFRSSHKLHRNNNKLSAETVRQFDDHQGNHSTFHMAGFFFGNKVENKSRMNTNYASCHC